MNQERKSNMTKKAKSAKLKKNQQPEMPLEGKGVEKLHIKSLETAADRYVEQRDARMALTEKEVSAKAVLMQAMRDERINLPSDGKGGVFYAYGDRRITLCPSEETVKVSKIVDEQLDVKDSD
jgi:hypothetical protein